MKCEPQETHAWLRKLVGEWTYESTCSMGPDQPEWKGGGTESVRSLAGVWVICEGRGEMPTGEVGVMMMTLGYDSQKQRFVGTWVGSMMMNLWVYDGELDAAGNKLTLTAEGPSMAVESATATYRDVIEFTGDDERTLKSYMLGDDGKWVQFMTATYRRKK